MLDSLILQVILTVHFVFRHFKLPAYYKKRINKVNSYIYTLDIIKFICIFITV